MPELDHFYSLFGVNDKTNVPLHRWIPTRNLSLLYKTPVAKSEYNAFGNNLHFWPLAAQAHYSLLQNIEEKRLGRYFMVHGSDEEAVSTWDMNGSRISINFMVIKGKDIIDNISNLQPDDENKLTVELPTLLNRGKLGGCSASEDHSLTIDSCFGRNHLGCIPFLFRPTEEPCQDRYSYSVSQLCKPEYLPECHSGTRDLACYRQDTWRCRLVRQQH